MKTLLFLVGMHFLCACTSLNGVREVAALTDADTAACSTEHQQDEAMNGTMALNAFADMALRCEYEDDFYYQMKKTGNEDYQVRVQHVDFHATDSSKRSAYSAWMSKEQFQQFNAYIRSQRPVKQAQLGKYIIRSAYQLLTVNASAGDQVLASIENYVDNMQVACTEGTVESPCIDYAVSFSLAWVYNDFFKVSADEDCLGCKMGGSSAAILKLGASGFIPIKDVRDVLPEAQLLLALKSDRLLRNSNRWMDFRNARSWNAFWNMQDDGYAKSSKFQSYSFRLNGAAQVRRVQECAAKADQPTGSFHCISQSVKGVPRIYIYNYSIYESALTTQFNIHDVQAGRVILRIPVSFDGGGGAELSEAVAVTQPAGAVFSKQITFQ